ncbi:MAG TPA: hypothetical protein VHP11_15555 [Tepidisphaeraceae bacterium]|nr:hypothetical protein [Tepidisphaeraceae bacterium]
MLNGVKSLVIIGLLVALAGCATDKPHEYGRQRPPVDALDDRDSGLQSKDVVSASDRMASDLLALPELRASAHQWTIVVDRFEDRTLDRQFNTNYDIFLERLRSKLSELGQGRVRLIENKARFHQIRGRELESERDDYQQGSGNRPVPPSVQPDFALYGKALDMPNRGTNYYLLQFDLSNLQTREQVWSRAYEVKVAR